MKKFFSTIGQIFLWVVKTIQGLGTVTLGLLVILFIVALYNTASRNGSVTLDSGSILVLRPNGVLVEQRPLRKPFQALSPFGGEVPTESVHTVLEAIKRATSDPDIAGIALYTDNFLGGSSALLNEVADALKAFKASDKPVYAISSAYTQSAYTLAAEADEIYLNSEGSVLLSGLSLYPTYYADLLEKIEATVNVFRVGTYKSAVEPYTRNSMSPEAKESSRALLDNIWRHYVERLSGARQMPVENINASVEDVVARLREAKGDFALMALNNGLVDHVGPRSLWRKALMEKHGSDKSGTTFKQINHVGYLAATDMPLLVQPEKEIAVITAQGTILPGTGPVDVAASTTIRGYIQQARRNPRTAAIVLRVDSPGGSAFASEVIREELAQAQQAGIPVIASMGGMAASGGYWISASADEIWAAPTTITGSIGIFAVIPTYENTAKKLGVTVDGVATSDLAGGLNPMKGLSDTIKQVLQLSIEDGYQDFLTLVANNRGMTLDEVDAIAQGRVWTGEQAHQLGLVDHLGSFDDAIKAAATRAEISSYSIRFYRDQMSNVDRFLIDLLDQASVEALTVDQAWPDAAQHTVTGSRGALIDLLGFGEKARRDLQVTDPNGRLILCMDCRAN